MDILGTILWPIKWAIELILVGFHWFWTNIVNLPTGAGITWVLSIVGLTVVVRAALIPIFVRQIKSQRRMLEVAPQIKKIQDKYKGKKDQFSREAMSRETMELYRKTGTNPLSSCLPLLLQMPIFFGLFSVLSDAQKLYLPSGKDAPSPAPPGAVHHAGVGLLNQDLATSFGSSDLFGAPLHLSMSTANQAAAGGGSPTLVIVIAAVMVVLMTTSQFITQLQIMSKNQSAEMKASPTYRQQRILLYLLPLVFAFSGFSFPLGVMFYWLTSNFWTMGQQFIVIRNMPTPGSEAALAREVRLARKRQRSGLIDDPESSEQPIEEPKTTQRAQPVNKNRAKKRSGKNKR
jgi:YidC/Oxa1 family membrane protein insertase